MEKILGLATMEKLLKKAGAERVGDDAKKRLAEILEDYAIKIGEKAVRMSMHAKRRTVKVEDINEAVKHL